MLSTSSLPVLPASAACCPPICFSICVFCFYEFPDWFPVSLVATFDSDVFSALAGSAFTGSAFLNTIVGG